MHTLFHIIDVEWSWIRILQGKPDFQENFDEYRSLERVREFNAALRPEVESFVRSWEDGMENRLLHDRQPDGSMAIDTWGEVVRHVIAHEIHHVGQLSIWAREAGKKPVSANLIGRGLNSPETGMKIRKLDDNELPPMALLLLADPSRQLVEEYLHRGQIYVADMDGTIIGVYVILPTRPATVELVNIAVDENQQGKGIGRQLVRHAVQTARTLGYQTIEVGTGNSGAGQLALYQKCGFRITGIDRDFFIRHYAEEIYENGIRVTDMVRLSQDL